MPKIKKEKKKKNCLKWKDLILFHKMTQILGMSDIFDVYP